MTSVYVKLDAFDQLLLSEGVCTSLGIVTYHPAVVPYDRNKERQWLLQSEPVDRKALETDQSEPELQTVRVQLVKAVSVLPCQETMVPVRCDHDLKGPLLVEPVCLTGEGVTTDANLLQPTKPMYVRIANITGFTQRLSENLDIGQAVGAEPLQCGNVNSDNNTTVAAVTSGVIMETESDQISRIETLFRDKLGLPPEYKEQLLGLLKKYHTAFSL